MKNDFSTRFTGALFIAAAALLWGGWAAMPLHIGTYFAPHDFAIVHGTFHWWIWTFRMHLFGMVVTVMALFALMALLSQHEARVMVWPGGAVASAGMIVGALGAAFYYHLGAWGALEMNGKTQPEIIAFINDLRVDTEYITCLVRFSRVFSGLGMLFVGIAIVRWGFLPPWLGWAAALLGLVSMALTMLLPDYLELYLPVFHVLAVWLLVMGVAILRGGFRLGF